MISPRRHAHWNLNTFQYCRWQKILSDTSNRQKALKMVWDNMWTMTCRLQHNVFVMPKWQYSQFPSCLQRAGKEINITSILHSNISTGSIIPFLQFSSISTSYPNVSLFTSKHPVWEGCVQCWRNMFQSKAPSLQRRIAVYKQKEGKGPTFCKQSLYCNWYLMAQKS